MPRKLWRDRFAQRVFHAWFMSGSWVRAKDWAYEQIKTMPGKSRVLRWAHPNHLSRSNYGVRTMINTIEKQRWKTRDLKAPTWLDYGPFLSFMSGWSFCPPPSFMSGWCCFYSRQSTSRKKVHEWPRFQKKKFMSGSVFFFSWVAAARRFPIRVSWVRQ